MAIWSHCTLILSNDYSTAKHRIETSKMNAHLNMKMYIPEVACDLAIIGDGGQLD